METLDKLFGSAVRVKLLKLFLMNPDGEFSAEEACGQAGIRLQQFKVEAERLRRLGIMKTGFARRLNRFSVRAARQHQHQKLVRLRVYCTNRDFPLFPELRTLMLKSAPHAKGQLAEKIKRLGAMKLAILSGVFIDDPASRVDLLLVGDGFKRSRMNTFIRWLEAEFGKQLNYVAMSTQEFRYRMDMYDRFLRGILESPHQAVINKLGPLAAPVMR